MTLVVHQNVVGTHVPQVLVSGPHLIIKLVARAQRNTADFQPHGSNMSEL